MAIDNKALYKIEYGLYVITSSDSNKDNGMICNTVVQVTSSPLRLAVTINKSNYTSTLVERSGIMNVCCLSQKAPFQVFEQLGFVSGKNFNKFKDKEVLRSDNGLCYLPDYINSFLSLKVVQTVDLGTHNMFICDVTEAQVLNDLPTMSYAYYQANVKPKPQASKVKGWVCTICGYVHEEEELPEDFVCPLCNHGAEFFEPIK